jgi:hypothetical protein
MTIFALFVHEGTLRETSLRDHEEEDAPFAASSHETACDFIAYCWEVFVTFFLFRMKPSLTDVCVCECVYVSVYYMVVEG